MIVFFQIRITLKSSVINWWSDERFGIFWLLPVFFFFYFFFLSTPGVTKDERRRRNKTGKWRVSVSLSVFTISNTTTVEKGEENWCSDLLLPYCRSCRISPEDAQGQAEEGGWVEEPKGSVQWMHRWGEERGKEDDRRRRRWSLDYLFLVPTPLDTQRLFVSVTVCVCGCQSSQYSIQALSSCPAAISHNQRSNLTCHQLWLSWQCEPEHIQILYLSHNSSRFVRAIKSSLGGNILRNTPTVGDGGAC